MHAQGLQDWQGNRACLGLLRPGRQRRGRRRAAAAAAGSAEGTSAGAAHTLRHFAESLQSRVTLHMRMQVGH